MKLFTQFYGTSEMMYKLSTALVLLQEVNISSIIYVFFFHYSSTSRTAKIKTNY